MSNDNHFVKYHYNPSLPAAAIFTVLFSLVTFLHIYQMFRTRTWIFIPFIVGGFFEAIGYVGRILSATETGPDWSLGPYIMQALLLLVAPALFAASIYMVVGRIVLVTDGESHSLIRKKWLTKVFVIGDVISFLTQATGGGVMSSGSDSSFKTGEYITIGGLAIQVIVFGIFMLVAAIFHRRMLQAPTAKVLSSNIPWQKHLNILYIASALILVRSVFRLVEYIQGFNGYILSHEWFLYVFDAVLMFAVMVLFAWVHPSEIYAILKGRGTKAIKYGVVTYSVSNNEKVVEA